MIYNSMFVSDTENGVELITHLFPSKDSNLGIKIIVLKDVIAPPLKRLLAPSHGVEIFWLLGTSNNDSSHKRVKYQFQRHCSFWYTKMTSGSEYVYF
jgi:hypothetical protein